ncbi:MAG TPA: 2,3-bisphosphoglycerate-independent phosphoglycerate mutase [Elusimicrobia bacterium]|nr:2,3-bisphosphoglycerate-independent phosphoglycerate mutase [Elusimicrobiota bacterium]HBT61366.1 2,3-bisphosphoglycerate-independent phosphoglycerate mutase [Elusimicrobiota bacterium]
MLDRQLRKLKGYNEFPGPLVTVIMDGVGLGKRDESDGVYLAYKPVLDALSQEKLFTKLKAHGKAVGLPSDEDMGNSEVGHNALGCGRVLAQGAQLVNEAVASGKIFSSQAWEGVRGRARAGAAVHFIGLLSDGNVHSHISQLYAMLERCGQEGFARVRVHPLLDGRDVGEKSALSYVEPLEQKLAALSAGGRDFRVASGGGRMVTTMDRYNANWAVVEKGWKTHVLGEGRQFKSASEAVSTYYAEDPKITDQYMDSFVVAEAGKPVGAINDGDAVIFFNFRGDRAIEISRAFDELDFKEFDRKRAPKVFYAGLMQYDGEARIPKNFLVEPPAIDRVLGEFLCGSGVTSFAVSETQKFGHVTYFWNGNNSGYIDEKLEKYVEIPSDKITFDLRPWMKAAEITDAALNAVAGGRHKFIRLNYPNGDMVGHTGVAPAVRVAVETVDLGLGRLVQALQKARGMLMVTADHGNADCLWTEKNGKRSPHVAHTLNPVPFIVKDFSGANSWDLAPVQAPGLSHVAATICNLLGYEAPDGYDPSLVSLG